jgi:hypothetical protein
MSKHHCSCGNPLVSAEAICERCDEEQGFRLQNDREWKSKVDFVRKQRDALHVECSGHMATIQELLSSVPAVKQLEWHYRDGQQFYTYYTEELGRAVYWINQQFGSDSFYFTTMNCLGVTLYDGDDLPSAKAAAQADYEARIHSALVSSMNTYQPKQKREGSVA